MLTECGKRHVEIYSHAASYGQSSSEAAYSTFSRCRLFCCGPQRSDQRSSCEKGYVELRRTLPKRFSFESLSLFDVACVCALADNYPRKSLNGKTL